MGLHAGVRDRSTFNHPVWHFWKPCRCKEEIDVDAYACGEGWALGLTCCWLVRWVCSVDCGCGRSCAEPAANRWKCEPLVVVSVGRVAGVAGAGRAWAWAWLAAGAGWDMGLRLHCVRVGWASG